MVSRIPLLHAARQGKHAAFVAKRKGVRLARRVENRVGQGLFPLLHPAGSYVFDPVRYKRSFLFDTVHATPGPFVPRVFTFWTGDNEMSPTRLANLDRLRADIGLEVVVVTPDNLRDWVLPDDPLHPSYPHLSLVHRADYLRAYFFHHHGGGYCDIKRPMHSWANAAREFAVDHQGWYAGSPMRLAWLGWYAGPLGQDLRRNFASLACNGAGLARPGSPLTAEWLAEVERRMSAWAARLEKYPGGVRGETEGYPFSWNDLLNRIHHPLSMKYSAHIRRSTVFDIDVRDYE